MSYSIALVCAGVGFLAGRYSGVRRKTADERKAKLAARSPNQRVWPKLYAIFPGGWNGGGGLVHYYNLSFHRQATDWYVRTHLESHGFRPVGVHSFDVRYAKNGDAPVRTPMGDSSGVRRITINFVMVAEADRADFEGTDLRYEVKTLPEPSGAVSE